MRILVKTIAGTALLLACAACTDTQRDYSASGSSASGNNTAGYSAPTTVRTNPDAAATSGLGSGGGPNSGNVYPQDRVNLPGTTRSGPGPSGTPAGASSDTR